ncbi:hypothetical protein DPEC_G00081820 [Dallia pectoralis]|uniref:Uncharacterized protein n=1 Tax=Dallia pectoralis TaxID=75939 RepID=A0ACC2GZ75_DALPE|nr:hypothetical protein DPEC_G00081820 [Dallia pectoralis]
MSSQVHYGTSNPLLYSEGLLGQIKANESDRIGVQSRPGPGPDLLNGDAVTDREEQKEHHCKDKSSPLKLD